jgi:hypothetical protein
MSTPLTQQLARENNLYTQIAELEAKLERLREQCQRPIRKGEAKGSYSCRICDLIDNNHADWCALKAVEGE